ncbi:DUF1287 domain-containing protein [Haloferula helveola]|uniref:DUF1287 domain-containing protein n=1 Tax=Haloferula helveola TaxID=490095 RepID=A0ABM7RJW9_9BACT|nr:DUF1287 domain-containing protein [Haloferula helveola]
MARRSNNHLDTIEYIGPRPQKPAKRPNFLAGWVVLLVAAGAVYFFGKPFLPLLQAQQTAPTTERADRLIAELQPSAKPGERLAAAALQRTQSAVAYEDAYYKIPYPNGDIPSDKGRAEDLVIRSYRALGIDLQKRVHEDMVRNFSEYPQIFGRKSADRNIDHRLTANLQRFFRRSGAELLVSTADGDQPSQDLTDYQPGDVVAWRLAGGRSHIGIVVPGPGEHRSESWVVHNIGSGPVWENCLLNFKVIGHYRYTGEESVDVTALAPVQW